MYVILQEQQQILSTYQNLVVKQLVSQSMNRKQEEAHQSEEWDEEARSVQHELLVLTPQVKDLPLAQKKNTVWLWNVNFNNKLTNFVTLYSPLYTPFPLKGIKWKKMRGDSKIIKVLGLLKWAHIHKEFALWVT